MRRMFTSFAILWLLVGSTGSAGLPTLAADGSAAIDRMFQTAIAKGEIPGVVAAVVNKDRILYLNAHGKQNVAQGVAMAKDTIFRIASMTKPVTSVAVMMMYEQGKLRLDDAASLYVPGFKGRQVIDRFNESDGSYTTRPASREVTIRDLLTNTSGLAYPFTSSTALAIQEKRRTDPLDMPLLFDPGTRWHYSPATAVLGQIVEKLSGQNLEEFDQARIFRPLGMADTSYLLAASRLPRLVTVHQRGASGLAESPNPAAYVPGMRGDGGLLSTAADYAAFVQMFLNGGTLRQARLLSPESVRLMTVNQIGPVVVDTMPAVMPTRSAAFPFGAGKDKFGFGFQIAATDGTASHERAAGSYTWAGINNTHFWVDPSRGVGVVYLTQVLPFYDVTSMDVMRRFETLIYRHLE